MDFRIETAAGPEAEAHLAVLARDEAERLKAELLSGRGTTTDDGEVPPHARVIWQASLGDLVLLGATSNRAGAIVGALAGLLFFLGQELPLYFERLRKGLEGVAGVVSALLAGTVLLGSMLLLGWLLSIGLTVVGYYGFQVTREPDGRLRRRYGLLSRFETLVSPARIQLLRLGASWLRRRLGFWEVAAHTAGSAFDGQGAGSALLCPLLRRSDLAAFCNGLLPGLDLETVHWQPVSRATIRRGFIRYLFLALVLVGTAAVGLGHWAWTAAILPGGLAAWALALRRYGVLAHARHAGHLIARTGVLRRRITIVPESKIQWVGLTQSPFQRRLGIVSVTVATAAGAAHIVDLDTSEAVELQQALSGAASAAGAWLPDAV